jgi:CO/xanthine dehydrogenase Mo-binding subunit
VARVIGAYDAGRIVNSRLAHSQCIGGIGMALLEEAEWDAGLGRVANAVWHATGQRMRELPITPDRLLMA